MANSYVDPECVINNYFYFCKEIYVTLILQYTMGTKRFNVRNYFN